MAQRIGLVLAGGAGRRLGRPKGDLRLGAKTWAERAALALWPHCGDVLVSVGPGTANPAPRFHVVRDEPPPNRGPLAGIHAAFRATGGADLLVLACDYPCVGVELLGRLVQHVATDADLVLLNDERGRDHPLVALWRRSAAAVVAEGLESGRLRVRSLLADLDVRRLRPEDLPGIDLSRELRNVNWPDDLEGLRGELEEAGRAVQPPRAEGRAWAD